MIKVVITATMIGPSWLSGFANMSCSLSFVFCSMTVTSKITELSQLPTESKEPKSIER